MWLRTSIKGLDCEQNLYIKGAFSGLMNYLAHAWCVREKEDWIIGSVLAHPFQTSGNPEPFLEGIALHRKLDAYAEQNDDFNAVRCLLQDHRRYAGIIADLLFDHALYRSLSRLGEHTFHDYVLGLLARNADRTGIRNGKLYKMARIDDVVEALDRVDARLSKRIPDFPGLKEAVRQVHMGVVQSHYDSFEASAMEYLKQHKGSRGSLTAWRKIH